MDEHEWSSPEQAWTRHDGPERNRDTGIGPCDLGVPGWADFEAARARFLTERARERPRFIAENRTAFATREREPRARMARARPR